MQLLHLLSLSLLLGAGSRGFNLAPRNASLLRDPLTETRSFFGYSVNLQRRSGEAQASSFWLIVGAPKANATSSKVLEPGVAYQCDLADMSCTPIVVDDRGNKDGITLIGSQRYGYLYNYSWVGGAIAVKHQPDGGIVVCGPRTKWIYHLYSKRGYAMNGLVYLKSHPFDSTENATKYVPLGNEAKQLYTRFNNQTNRNESDFLYAHGEAGFSAEYTQDDTELVIGAPGVQSWTGTVVRFKNFGHFNESMNVPRPSNIVQLDEYSYFGYAVSSGKLLSSGGTCYVAGAPRAGLLTGKVLVFQYPDKKREDLDVLTELEGSQMGEYFGASVCVVDLNGDLLDDLVVGAPHHSLDTQSAGDEGRVYVFINEDMRIFREVGEKNKIMGSQKKNSLFGTTVANIGDLNLDGYNDIAVGAPYEEAGRGAIYIYHGRSSGIHLKYSQRITAAEIHSSLSGFGISISRGVDVDNNYYNDLAVGAFNSGHAVLIPSQPVVSVRTRLSSDVTTVGLNATGFSAIACLSYTGQRAPPTTGLLITLQVSSDESAVFSLKGNSTYQYYRLLNNNKEHCDQLRVEMIKGVTRDYTKPIELHLRYELDYRHQVFATSIADNGFCKTCPVVDPSHKTTTSWTVPYAIECGADDVCRTDLNVKVNFVGGKSQFILGSQPKLSLRVLVSNRGEQAFLVKVNASLPRDTPLSRLPSICQETSESDEMGAIQLECDIGSVLTAGDSKEFLLELEMTGLGPKVKFLEYVFNVTSVGEEQRSADNLAVLVLPVQTIPDVSIQGQSSQDRGNYSKHNQTFFHTYEIRNHGPSPADILRLEFHIPIIARGLTGDRRFVRVFKPSAYFDKQPISCIPLAGHSFEVADDKHDATAGEEEHSLAKRSIEVELSNVHLDPDSHADLDHLPTNRTLAVNCSSPDYECLYVHCDAGPFKTPQNRAIVSFRLVADFVRLEPIIGKKDIVVMSSRGTVKILNLPEAVQPSDGRPDEAFVNSVFFGSRKEEAVDSWLLAMSIAVGILILFLIVGALAKMGFFLRTKRTELNELKEECEGRLMMDVENESEGDLLDVNLNPGEDRKS